MVNGVASAAFVALRPLRQFRQSRQLRYVRNVPCVAYVACVALGGNPALRLWSELVDTVAVADLHRIGLTEKSAKTQSPKS